MSCRTLIWFRFTCLVVLFWCPVFGTIKYLYSWLWLFYTPVGRRRVSLPRSCWCVRCGFHFCKNGPPLAITWRDMYGHFFLSAECHQEEDETFSVTVRRHKLVGQQIYQEEDDTCSVRPHKIGREELVTNMPTNLLRESWQVSVRRHELVE